MSILDEAKALVGGDRASDYGDFKDNADGLAKLWSVVLGSPVPVEKVPLMLIMLKAVRLAHSPTHRDSWVDLAGYVECAGKLPTIGGTDALTDSGDGGGDRARPIAELDNVFKMRREDP